MKSDTSWKYFFKNAFQYIGEKNFGSKCGAKQKTYEQSVAHYTSQAKSWALRGCESTNKTVGRDYLHTLLNENKNKFQEENHHFIFSVPYGEIP